jgi:peroxiredoxin
MFRLLLTVLALGVGVTCAVAADAPESIVGAKAPALTLSGLNGKAVDFDSVRGKSATIVLFISFDCPVSNSYVAELNELAKTQADKGVAVVMICPTDEAPEAVARAAAGFKLSVPVLLDSKKELAAGLKARATPEAFLLDADGMVRYRGRIDDAFSSRLKRNAQISSRDLSDALQAVLAGKPVPKAITTPIGCAIEYDGPAVAKAGVVTYYKDVAPILAAHCSSCHRAGEVGPFSLTTYNQARRWASDIKEYSANRQMPPWMPTAGLPMKGERKLAPAEIATLAAWADAGAPEGDPKDAVAKSTESTGGWRHGQPDLILTPDGNFHLAASGDDVFRVFVIPTNLTENKWVVGYDVKPGNPRVVHHTLNFFDGTGQGRALEKKQLEKDKEAKPADFGPGYNVAMGVGFVAPPGGDVPKFGGIGGWAPGQSPQFLPKGSGWLLPKGSDFLIQTHYHRNGQASDDHTQIGLYFAKEPIDLPWQTVFIQAMSRGINHIPAGNPDYVIRGSRYFATDAVLHNVLPHMHLLGKSVTVTMTPPGGQTVVLVDIPHWDYRWQETYWFKEPIPVKAGTRVEILAHFDNSEANPNNPSKPPRDVGYGEQTTDEMLFAFFGVTSAVKPSQQVQVDVFPPDEIGEPPARGKLTPLLEGLVGKWETTTAMKVLGSTLTFKGEEVAKPVFGGAFVSSKASLGNRRGLSFRYTFNTDRNAYHLWLADPQGGDSQWTGVYDEKTKTMTWTLAGSDDITGVMHWKFADSGGYVWDLSISSAGKPVIELSGERTKKK